MVQSPSGTRSPSSIPRSSRSTPPAPEHVLVVEDDSAVRRYFARILEQAGFVVTTASDGQVAAYMLVDGKYSAVVCDIALPRMSGIELLRCARVHDLDVPVVLVTAAPDVQTAADALNHGAFQLLMKPVSPGLLVAEVRRATRRHALAVSGRHAMRLLEVDQSETERLSVLGASYDSTLSTLWMAMQPIVTPDGAVFGYEALLRSEDQRLPNPMAVLDAAERLGRLPELARVTRERAVKRFADAPADAMLFLNLHPRDLLDDSLIDPNGPLTGMASRVVLEITERTSLEGLRGLHERISEFRALGFRLAIDDLGAGYAGLTSFASLEPEFAKIDMSLVRDIDQSATKRRLVGMIAAVCREMGTQVVAEGIETAAERDVVVELGCTLLQGFHIGRPAREFSSRVHPCTG